MPLAAEPRRCAVFLPFTRFDGSIDPVVSRALARLVRSPAHDSCRSDVSMAPRTPLTRAGQVYVHAHVSVFLPFVLFVFLRVASLLCAVWCT